MINNDSKRSPLKTNIKLFKNPNNRASSCFQDYLCFVLLIIQDAKVSSLSSTKLPVRDKTLDKIYFETLHIRHTSNFMSYCISTLSVLSIPWLYGKMHHTLKSNSTSHLSSIFINWDKYYDRLKLAIILNKSRGHLHFAYTLGSGAFSTAMTLLLIMLESFSTYYMTTISTLSFINIQFSLFRTSPHLVV
jgi:hypothetical protein